jgi:aminoglycoside 3-N-acetyltransferase
VAARGKGAQEFVGDHLGREGLESPWDREPWGRTYGTHSPMFRAYEADGKILMIGVDYHSSTYVHLVEVMYWHRCRERDPNAPYSWLRRPELGEFWDRQGRLRRGKVGDADCRLFHIKDYVDTLVREVEANPGTYIK